MVYAVVYYTRKLRMLKTEGIYANYNDALIARELLGNGLRAKIIKMSIGGTNDIL